MTGPLTRFVPRIAAASPPAPFSPFRIDALAHDDRIVDDDPESEDEAHEREHVDGQAQEVHHEEGARERDGQAHGHPQREPDLQKQREGDEDEDQAEQSVLHHEAQPPAHQRGVVAPDRDIRARGQARQDFRRQVFLHRRADAQQLFVGGAVHVHAGRRATVVAHAQFGVREAVAHHGDVAHADRRSIRTGEDDDVLEIRLDVIPPQRAHEDLVLAGGHLAGREFQRALPHGARDILQRQTQRAKPALRNLHRYLVGAGSACCGEGHLG